MKQYSTLKIVSPEEFNKEFFRAKLFGYKVETNTYLSKHQIKLNKKVRVSRPNIVYIKK